MGIISLVDLSLIQIIFYGSKLKPLDIVRETHLCVKLNWAMYLHTVIVAEFKWVSIKLKTPRCIRTALQSCLYGYDSLFVSSHLPDIVCVVTKKIALHLKSLSNDMLECVSIKRHTAILDKYKMSLILYNVHINITDVMSWQLCWHENIILLSNQLSR